MTSHIISFPGLNIGPFTVDPVAFNLFGRDVMWYGVIICVGIIAAFFYGAYRTKKEGVLVDHFYDAVLFAIPSAVVGARLYYVIFDPTPNYHSFIDVIAVWRGGIAIYGAIIGGAAAVIITALVKKKNPLLFCDIFAPAVMIGQIIGRWGNFVNAEAFGGACELPWRMGIASPLFPDMPIFVHPTFLYESLWNFAGLLVLHFVVAKRKKYTGQITFFYLAWYGFGRMLIEPLRTDSLKIGIFDVSTLVGFLCFAVFATLYVVFLKKEKKNADN